MRTKNKETIRQRIKSRLKGLAALAIAVVMAASMLPVTEAKAAETGYYYFAIGGGFNDGILGNGTVEVHQLSDFAKQQDGDRWTPVFTSGISRLGVIGHEENSDAVTINPGADTTFYYGGVQSGGFRIYLDGTQKTTGYYWYDKYSSFELPAGKYTVQHTSSIYEDHQYTWKIEVNTVIESIKLSSSSLNFTIGDTSQKLTVDPSAAKVDWKTGNESIATVDNEGNVKPVGVGETEITATLTTDATVKATCKVTVKGKEIVLTEDQKPTAKTDLKENGEAQELVNAPKAPLEGTAMNYALGKDSSTAPTTGWSTTIPAKTEAGTYHVWYYAKGDSSHADSEAESIEVTIGDKERGEIKTDSKLPGATKGEEYSVTLELKNPADDMDWTVSEGDKLPEGLGLDSKTGKISGTPVKAGDYSFTIKENKSAAEKKFTLTVKEKEEPGPDPEPEKGEIKTDSKLPGAKKGEKYSVKIELTKEPAEGESWKITSGRLPKGLKLDSKTGEISGKPEETGKFTFTLQEENTKAEKEFRLTVKDSDDDDDDHDRSEHTPASWILNPNEKQQLVIKFTGTPLYLAAGYQEQGEAAKALFAASTPAGWKKAFSFNLLNKDRQPEMNLKTGTMTLYIPSEYLKDGRSFALIILDKNGKAYVLSDTDTAPGTVTVPLNSEGYAVDLIYKD